MGHHERESVRWPDRPNAWRRQPPAWRQRPGQLRQRRVRWGVSKACTAIRSRWPFSIEAPVGKTSTSTGATTPRQRLLRRPGERRTDRTRRRSDLLVLLTRMYVRVTMRDAGSPSPATHAVLTRAEANLAASRGLGFERLCLAREWALLHAMDPAEVTDPRCRPTPLGATGLLVEEYAAAELAVSLEMHPLAAGHLMADALDIAERLPHLWAALAAGRLEAWVARKIASATSDLACDRARWVDAAITGVAGTLPPGGCSLWWRPGWSKPTRHSPRRRPPRPLPGARSGWDARTTTASAPWSHTERPPTWSRSSPPPTTWPTCSATTVRPSWPPSRWTSFAPAPWVCWPTRCWPCSCSSAPPSTTCPTRSPTRCGPRPRPRPDHAPSSTSTSARRRCAVTASPAPRTSAP